MQIRVSKFNITTSLPSIKRVSQIPDELKLPGNIQVLQLANMNPQFVQIVKNISGIPTIEDSLKIEELRKFFSSLSIDEVSNIYRESLQLYTDKYPFAAEKNGKEYRAADFLCFRKDLTEHLQESLKEDEIKLIALKQSKLRDYPKCIASYDEWFDCGLKIPSYKATQTIFEHPYDKAIRLVGDFNRDDIERSEEIEKQYKDRSFFDIIEEKFKIIEKMNKYLYSKNTDFYGQFSKKECAEIKELALKFRVLNHLQHDYGFSSKHLESVLYSKPAEWVRGNYVEGIGLITDEINVNGKDSVITFQYDNGKYCFRIYDKEVLTSKNKFLSELPETIYLEDLNELNKKANQLIKNERIGLISEIRFTVKNREMIENYFRSHNIPPEYAETVLEGGKYAYLIENFKNFDKKDSPSAARIISIRLLKLLKEKNAYPLFAMAQPYDSTHSPVSMYLRAGFKPLSRTMEEVQGSMSKHCEYMDNAPLIMYLKDFNDNKSLIDSLAQLYFK